MRRFYLNPCSLEKWIYQNGGVVADCIVGCLLDNLVVDCKRGTAFIFEHYVNANSSDYLVEYCRTGVDNSALWDRFDALEGVCE